MRAIQKWLKIGGVNPRGQPLYSTSHCTVV